jgi:protein-S-isoprenylcysteine O-methyltransferase Ste14
MNQRKYPYIYDLIASLLTFLILVLSNILKRGENVYLKFTGVCFLAVAAIIWVLPFIQLKKYGNVQDGRSYYETNQIVDQGIYKIVRHPQYLGYILLVIGFALLSQNWIITVLALFAISLFYIHTLNEERELTSRFTNDYLDYCQKVPRFNIVVGILKWLQR